ncbi:MAG: hypothetical protein M3N48_11410 [Verrucomicrobiota bacterium]|nr:hypothetical protein [Verrucomicrobiota bacterium]
MSQFLGGFWNGDKFDWKSSTMADLQDAFVIEFFIPATRTFRSPDEARDFAAHLIRKVNWCKPAPGDMWSFEFDGLRRHLQIALPQWLSGTASTIPVPRLVTLAPRKPDHPTQLDTLAITCSFVHNSLPPTVHEIVESANRPPDIRDSLSLFRRDYPDLGKVAFVMMKFGATKAHNLIYETIQSTLAAKGMTAIRADEKVYHDNLFENVLTYLHGCRFGIAVFERLSGDEFNPNVSLELGYMLALRKPVCLLKDMTLRALHTDLLGRIYRGFDPESPATSIPRELESWMREKQLLKREGAEGISL